MIANIVIILITMLTRVTMIIMITMINDHHDHQGQPEICVPMTLDSKPGLFFMSGDWFDLASRSWQRAR